ncbi:MAG: RteC domain-containing protein [Rikenellaceae bacterium]
MNNILNGRFISALTPDNNQNNNNANLAELFNEFRDNLLIICKTHTDYEELFILLTELAAILGYAIDNKESKSDIFYISRAKCLVNGYLQLLNLGKLTSDPELSKKGIAASNKSNFFWNGTSTELAELLTAINLTKSIMLSDGRTAPFTEIVKSFEGLLNIKLGPPRDIKRDILSRKTKRTVFLDRLRVRLSNDEF